MSDKKDSFDLINLSGPLTVEAILKTIQRRFNEGHCYTWVGPVLLCVNPYEPPGQLTHGVLRHLAELVLSELSEGRQQTAVVFNGVSGSGKSFTAEQLLVKMFQIAHKTDWLQDLRKYWQVSSVVLKALGSASTHSNKDSSRIGRMVDFCLNGLQITKVKINCFFLDQTRIVSPNPMEQNYHIFYQLLAGLSAEERKRFNLNYHEARTLHYLSQGLEPKESQAQLQSHFEAWKSSLAQLGIPLTDVLKVLVALMLVGNVLFYEAKNSELSMQGMEELEAVSSLLGVDPVLLQQGLTLRTYSSDRGEAVQSPCSAAAANGARDALAKALYIRTVVAIMRRINTLLRGASHRTPAGIVPRPQSANERTIHVVDLFGMEGNEVNSLEQLCVNYCAEKLQHYYTTSMFTNTTEMCRAENVDPLFESSLYDCTPCIELIGDQETGLVQLLNQETLSPRVSSEDIRLRLRDKFQNNRCFVPSLGSSSTFTVRHFGGEVVYDIYNLLNANADTIADDIIATFNSKDCTFGFVAHLFAVELNRDLHSDGTPKGQMCRITPAYLQHASTHSESRNPTTYIQDFQSNVGDVFTALKKSKPWFIQCLKSNATQSAGHFDKEVIAQQIHHMGMFETVDLIQSGFIHWLSYQEFITRYQMLTPDIPNGPVAQFIEYMMSELSRVVEDLDTLEESYALGDTKIFLNEEFRQCLEKLRDRILNRAVVRLQAAVRMYLCRKHWPQLKFSLQQAKLQGEAHVHLLDNGGGHHQNGQKMYTVRNYTIVGNYKVGFPQWRVMKCQYPDSGPTLLRMGDEVFVLGRSQKRGYLIVEHSGQQIHMPHHYTELRLTPPGSPLPPPASHPQQTTAPPRLARATGPPQQYSDL